MQASNEMTVEAWVAPSSANQSGPARIVTSTSSPLVDANFMLGQGAWGSLPSNAYAARFNATGTPTADTMLTPAGTATTNLTHVALTRTTAGTQTLYVNGVARATSTRTGTTSNWNTSFPLSLANAPTGNRPWLGTFCDVAIYASALTATDIADNAAAGCSPTPNTDPVLDPVADQTNDEGDTVTLDVNATDTDPGDVLVYSATGLPDGLTIDPATGEITGTITQTAAASSPYTVDLTADDQKGGTDTTTIDWTVNPVNVAPVLDPIGDQTSGQGQNVSLTVTATDDDNDDLLFTATGLPAGWTIDPTTGEITGLADTTGTSTVTVTVDDQNGATDDETFDWAIVGNADPVLDPVADQTNDEGDTVLVDVNATDTDPGDVLVYSATGLPDGLTIDPATGEITGTITQTAAASSPYTVDLTADDQKGGTDTTTIDWTVNPVNVAPVLDAVADQANTENDAVTLDIDATDDDDDTLVYTASGLPPGLGIVTATGEITGTIDPGAAAGSPYTVELTADDQNGETDTTTITWTVTTAPTGPTPVVHYDFTDGAGTTVADSGAGAPLDLTINNPGNVSWIPGGGLTVDANTVIASAGAASKVTNAVQASNEMTLVAWVRPDVDEQSGPARIVTSTSSPLVDSNFMLGQGAWGSLPNDTFATRFNATGTPSASTMFSPAGTAGPALTQVALTRDTAGNQTLYVNGVAQATSTRTGTTSNWVGSFPLSLANTPDGTRSWLGTFCDVAIYDSALTSTDLADDFGAGCDLAAPPAEILVQVTPGGPIGATTFGNASITVTNQGGPGAPNVTGVAFDLSGSLIPDATFDPIGTAGDEGTQCLAVSSEGGTGFIPPADPCTDPFFAPHEDSPGVPGNGWDGMALNFGDFEPGESIVFGVDVDPTTIQGAAGSGGAGAISGLELTGSPVLVTLSDGSSLAGQLFGDGSDGGGQVLLSPVAGQVAPTGIEMLGVTTAPTVFPNNSFAGNVATTGPQTVRVSGPVGAEVTLLSVEAALLNPGGFDIDPDEADAATAVDYPTGTIGAGGFVDFPVSVNNVSALYHYVAAIDDGGALGLLTDILIIAPPVPPTDVLVQVTPGGPIGATTFGNASITVTNQGGPGAPNVTGVAFDLSGSLIPDATFDPIGTAGDEGTQCLEVSSEGGTGYVVPADNCTDPFFAQHQDSPGVPGNGWDGMQLNFDDFNPGESIVFGVDVDPTTIQGVAGSGGAGAISGLELTGSPVLVTLSDGSSLAGQLFGDGSNGGGQAALSATTGQVAPTGIEMLGVTTAPTVFPNNSFAGNVATTGPQTVRVSGPVGAQVTLLDVEAALLNPGGFDIDPDEADAAVAVAYPTGTIGAGGFVDLPVTISDDTALHHYVAAIDDGGTLGLLSDILVIGVGDTETPVITPIADVVVDEGDPVNLLVEAVDPNGDPLTIGLTSNPDIEALGAVFTDNTDGTANLDWTTEVGDAAGYTVDITVTDGTNPATATFTITVVDPTTQPLARVNAGGPLVVATDGGPDWSEDQAAAAADAGGTAVAGTNSSSWVAGEDKTYGTADTIDLTDPSVPADAPEALFQTERYDPDGGEELVYEFDVASGVSYAVDLYFAEIFATANDVREFAVDIEGTPVLADYDVHELVGHDTGIVATLVSPVVADDTLTITFTHQVENPKVNAIEVRPTGPPPTDVPPTVGVIADQTVQIGGSLTLPVTTTEFDGDPITLGYTSNPDASTFTAFSDVGDGSGELTFAPIAGDDGLYDITVTATDKDGSDDEVFTLEVTDPPVPGTVFSRLNTGGPTVAATDGGPDWLADSAAGNTAGFPAVEPGPTVPSYVPGAIFDTERYNSAGLSYAVPVAAGTQTFVRLFIGNGCACTQNAGQRVFDITIDGALVENDLDLIPTFGHEVGGMLEYLVSSDGVVNIDLLAQVENPMINGIEIVSAESSPDELGASPSAVDFGTTIVTGSKSQTVSLSNLGFDVGDPTITVNSVTTVGGEFSDDFPGGPLPLGPGGSVSFDVTFSPTSAGAQTGTVTVDHTGTNSPLVIDLDGFGSSDVPVSFDGSGLSGESSNNPTSLQFGPDDRLYVVQQNGTIFAYTMQRNGPGDYQVVATEQIDLIKQTPNHQDDGADNGTQQRQSTGLLVAGTTANPVLYVSSSDWRISVGNDSNLDTNSGVVSRLTWNGSSWDKVDLVRGLPRSEENHASNGMDIDPATNTLLLAQGGHANKGAPGNNFSGTPEYFYSASIIAIDLDAIEALPVSTDQRYGNQFVYDLRTLNDPDRADIDNTSPVFPYAAGHPLFNSTVDVGDPFGGNNGQNQAIPEPGGPVQIYAPGFRNPFDVVVTADGKVYTSDNGPNGGWGGLPLVYASDGTPKGTGPFDQGAGDYCTNEFNESGSNGHGDPLHFVDGQGYYGGHPAPIRAFPSQSGVIIYEDLGSGWVETASYDFGDLLPSGLTLADFPDNPVECEYSANDPAKYVDIINASTNGIAEYTASNFGGSLQGSILTASFDGNIYRYGMNAAGDTYLEKEALFGGFGSQPLDVIAEGDDDPFPGTVWAATYGADTITVFEPVDFGTCTGADDPGLDDDGDGYSNADEIDNGTNPCSAGSTPPDNDGDLVSDLNDTDDDDDGIPDVDDAFAIDPDNGTTTDIPVDRPFWNDDPGTGFFGIGMTGLMTNGATDYLDQFDPDNLAAGGAGGILTAEVVTDGDAYQGVNSQENAFQYGINADATTDPFVIHTQLEPPFFDGLTPQNFQSLGVYLGTGDQDDYLKFVVNANGGAGGVQVLLEEAAVATSATQYGAAQVGDVLTAGSVDLYLVVDPAALTVQPQISLSGAAPVDVGPPVTIPAGWLDDTDAQGLAVGVISTSNGPGPDFGASWDFLDVYLLAGNAPVIDPIADLSIDEGATQSVIADIADIDGDTVTVDVTSVPDGSSFITDTLVENGAGDYTLTLDLSPLAGDAGVYDVTITASDGANPDVVETFELTVVEPGAAPTVLYRVNAGGVAEAAADASLPAWGADTDAVPSPYRVANGGGGSTFAGSDGGAHPGPIVMTDPSIPASAPAAVFDVERWDPPAVPEMLWEFPIDPGTTQVEVNLLFAELYSGVTAAGQRVFDVAVEGTVPAEFDDIDPFGVAGAKGAFARSTTVAVTDGTLNLDFLHDVIENPAIKGIEILDVTPANDAPVVDPIADQTVAENAPFSLQVVATDTDPLSYALSDEVPEGMTIDAAGLIEFTPDWDDSGSYDLVVEVDDGTNPAATEAFTLAVTQTDAGTVLRRVNVGGPTPDVPATDAGPDWSANPNPNTLTELTGGGNNVFLSSGGSGVPVTDIADPTVPASTPIDVFQSERWDPGAAPEMTWNFAATPGSLVEVRIGHAEIFNGVTSGGARQYDVLIDGVLAADDVDPYGTAGSAAGFVTDHVVIADGDGIDIEFVHVLDNPNPKSIEIIELVPAPNVAPTVDSFVPAGPVVVNQGTTIPTITVNASDLNGDTIVLTSDGGEPTGVTFADLGGGVGELTGTANDAPGTYTVTVTATDPSLAAGTGTVDIEIVINDPPTIDPIVDQTVAEQTPFSLGVVANDTEALSYALSGDVPTGMTIDPTGLIGWTPGLADSGRYAITVEVDDGTNPPATESFTLDVTQTAPPGSAIHRVDVGGAGAAASDASYPDWAPDTNGAPSPFRTGGSNNIFGPGVGISDLTHPTVTGTAPQSIYEQERYDTTGGTEMTWAFPVDAGTDVELRLYFAELFNGITAPGQRRHRRRDRRHRRRDRHRPLRRGRRQWRSSRARLPRHLRRDDRHPPAAQRGESGAEGHRDPGCQRRSQRHDDRARRRCDRQRRPGDRLVGAQRVPRPQRSRARDPRRNSAPHQRVPARHLAGPDRPGRRPAHRDAPGGRRRPYALHEPRGVRRGRLHHQRGASTLDRRPRHLRRPAVPGQRRRWTGGRGRRRARLGGRRPVVPRERLRHPGRRRAEDQRRSDDHA